MTKDVLSPANIERCQSAVLKFLPPPVTDKHHAALENYKAGNLRELRADTIWGGDYAGTLCSLLNANQPDFDAVKCLKDAAERALKYAGVANDNELYSQLSEISPVHFSELGKN